MFECMYVCTYVRMYVHMSILCPCGCYSSSIDIDTYPMCPFPYLLSPPPPPLLAYLFVQKELCVCVMRDA